MEELKIELKPAWDDKGTMKIIDMMKNEDGISDIFKTRIDRVATAEYSFLILLNDIEVGFVLLVPEKLNYDFYFLDVGIKKEYRNMGIGTKVLNKLIEMNFSKYIIVETQESNELANSSISKVGIKLSIEYHTNIYLLQKDKKEEFDKSEYSKKLIKHYDEPARYKRDIIRY